MYIERYRTAARGASVQSGLLKCQLMSLFFGKKGTSQLQGGIISLFGYHQYQYRYLKAEVTDCLTDRVIYQRTTQTAERI